MCVLLLFSLCCGIQNRRVQHAEPYIAPPLPLHAGSGFPHGMQYGSPRPPPAQYPYPTGTSDSEYPPVGAAEFAPPPYVKDSGAQYAPPPGPPRGIEAAYSPHPGPPPRAHISSNSADFNGSFRPPPAAS
ncbi:hypothetical protein DFH09DRAFT_1277619 [Mycena vulgaris]|nr:hypothetical protein DFH09DRAFT_1277619 [Mycena vulgaris]